MISKTYAGGTVEDIDGTSALLGSLLAVPHDSRIRELRVHAPDDIATFRDIAGPAVFDHGRLIYASSADDLAFERSQLTTDLATRLVDPASW